MDVTTVTTVAELDPSVHELLESAMHTDGRHPLSDHLRLELTHGGAPGFAAVTTTAHGHLAGYGQLALINGIHNIEVVVAPIDRADPSIARRLLATAVELADGGPVQWWAFSADGSDDELARSVGLAMARELLQMRRPLPTGLPVEVSTRAFVPGQDEDAFLAVNNRAFASHPEQGAWTHDTIAQREDEPWFDPDGFLLHEREGRLAAFCWTKLHDEEDPVVGEIYVIAVDPDFQGLKLGTQLTLAGLASIADRGVGTGMLHVDGANTAAVTMYERLGFSVHRIDRAYTR